MEDKTFWRNLANLLRRMPWIVQIGRFFWGFSRARFSAGVIGLVRDDSGHILLVEHVFHPHTPWGLPGGWIDDQEDPAEALRREFMEELELEIDTERVLSVVGESNHIDIAFLCSTKGQIGKLSNELLSYRWFDVQDLPRLQKFHYRAIMSVLSEEQKS
jgi:8-oxo-dGTP pyrophosphatase MutT (NUDIX family)